MGRGPTEVPGGSRGGMARTGAPRMRDLHGATFGTGVISSVYVTLEKAKLSVFFAGDPNDRSFYDLRGSRYNFSVGIGNRLKATCQEGREGLVSRKMDERDIGCIAHALGKLWNARIGGKYLGYICEGEQLEILDTLTRIFNDRRDLITIGEPPRFEPVDLMPATFRSGVIDHAVIVLEGGELTITPQIVGESWQENCFTFAVQPGNRLVALDERSRTVRAHEKISAALRALWRARLDGYAGEYITAREFPIFRTIVELFAKDM